jgi:hypothetical protein
MKCLLNQLTTLELGSHPQEYSLEVQVGNLRIYWTARLRTISPLAV